MKIHALFAAAVLCALPVLPVHAQAPSAAPAEKPLAVLDLKNDIDGGLRWLRYAQDKDSGAYGGSVETTAIVLRAFIRSPRKYQRVDGPFVQRALDYLVSRQAADGSIHDADATGEAKARQTRVAAAALALHAHVSTGAALEKAMAFLGKQPDEASIWNDKPLPAARDELIAAMKSLLAGRNAEGTWDGPGGKVRETAQAVMTLVRAYPILKPADAPGAAPKPLPAFEPADKARALAAIERGATWLAAQADKGRYGAPGKPDAGMTAMALGGLLAVPEPRPAQIQSVIDEGLAWLVTQQQPDGSIHQGRVANYTTSAAIMALVRAHKPEFKPVIEKARNWIVALQVGAEEGYSADHPYYGGIGYGSSERPDLSNLQMALEALSDSGLEKDHEAFQRALKFLERCQNRSESNDIAIPDGGKTITGGDDGGSAYAPGQSFAGFVDLEGGKRVPRSYGSMTYALLKGYAFAGLPKDDPRMKAAFEWVSKNYTLDVNPGFDVSVDPGAAYQGLYYYFHTMAKALDLYGADTITDAQGKTHSWRKDLAGRIVGLQSRAGSWTNENSERWYEGNPQLATAYALMALGMAAR
ncbi:MAG: terpene cyclase/mutase family protein [Planctomycetes bacterium]|nr:terpene cyclase/mutase family protein [Planctomycetota bacterium]